MALNLYRRHRRDCKAGHPEDFKSSDLDERKKGWKRCECPIFASGSLDRNFRRQSTGRWEWSEAKAITSTWEAAGSWGDPKLQPPQPDLRSSERATIPDAAEAFLARCQNRGIALPTYRKYQTFIKQLRVYCDSRGYLFLDQLTVSDMDRFYASWKDGKRAKAKKLDRLKSFIRFCLKRDWIAKNIADDLKVPEGSSIPANKTPFTDEEMDRIYAVCDALGGPTPRGPGHRPWSGEDVKTFVLLSVFTGLRISDVAMFNTAERLRGNDVFLRMHKTQKELYTWIPDFLVDRLRDREKKHGPMIFGSGRPEGMVTVAKRWRGYLERIFKLAGPWNERAHPHRFRHTFVRILLEKGVPLPDLADLVGDTPEIVAKHYSKWVKTRQNRLSQILKEAFDDKAKPKIVSIR